MTYWHMQLHPTGEENDYDAGEIVQTTKLIGMGDWIDERSQKEQFEKQMEIGDIVVVRKGSIAKALVKVIGEFEDRGYDTYRGEERPLDWFRFRRKVEILEIPEEDMLGFPQPRGTLQKSINQYTQTYNYINGWYKKHLNPNQDDLGFKIRDISIDNYKMFDKFSIDFLDTSGEPLSIVVLAGINGSGKTTLLESIISTYTNINGTTSLNTKDNLSFQMDGKKFSSRSGLNKAETLQKLENGIDKFPEDNLIYLSAIAKYDNEIEKLFLKYIDYFIYDRSKNAAVGVANLQKDMDEIFDGFNLNFYFKKIDHESKKPIFGNEHSMRDDIGFSLSDLSTGEKTLLSKILFLYLKEPKNKVILIDEPETSLHPSWQNKILKFYENFAKINNCQIILATHSPHIIGSAKNEYIRFLEKNEDGNIIAINDITAYGRDIEWVLEQMGVKNTRLPKITKCFDEIQELINIEEFEKADDELDKLEYVIGDNDKDILTLRNDLAFERMDFEED